MRPPIRSARRPGRNRENLTVYQTLREGNRISRSAGDFNSDGILPGYLVHGPGIPSGAYVKSVDSNTQVTLSEPATATASNLVLKLRFPPGLYRWEERVTKSGELYTADSGVLGIDPDIASAPVGALQTREERLLPLVEDIIEGRVTSDMESYQIAERAKVAVRMRDWWEFRAHLQRVVAARRYPGRLLRGLASFTGPSA